ncbi:MAG TPA: NAD-dependent epimerase/dehydratase family protein [Gemmataceae bacterium]|jgi:nucleoside-diphosphate-sugar epimerase
MKCVVTGAAGFIGSHLCEHLLTQGHEVHGLDAFIPYYPAAVKVRNLDAAMGHRNFRFHRLDLRHDPLDAALAGADVVFHLAAMPGLTKSWTDFDGYWTCNVLATQRLLEALRRSEGSSPRLVYASTSSVYGRMACGDESQPTEPVSPYGTTKLAAESLCRSYAGAYGLPAVVLRYFSVYGPRQRPDMGYHKFIAAMLRDEPVTVCGDGEQVRGNTYVGDCVAATVAAAAAPPGEVYNVGGGEAASVWDILRRLESLAGRPARVRREPARPGDQRHTLADTSKLTSHLGWRPRIGLDSGLARQWEWQAQELAAAPAAEMALVG